jgi:hypothetical protein
MRVRSVFPHTGFGMRLYYSLLSPNLVTGANDR